jgi:hypothetical protein
MLLVGFGRDDFDVAPFPVVALLVAAPFLNHPSPTISKTNATPKL